jgi:hypothetical protein
MRQREGKAQGMAQLSLSHIASKLRYQTKLGSPDFCNTGAETGSGESSVCLSLSVSVSSFCLSPVTYHVIGAEVSCEQGSPSELSSLVEESKALLHEQGINMTG